MKGKKTYLDSLVRCLFASVFVLFETLVDTTVSNVLFGDQENINPGTKKGLCLQFSDIRYTVKIDNDKETPEKTILHGVSGKIEGGNMLCCLGPSGSGKTSLIHIVSGYIKSTTSQSHQVSGKILVDGKTLSTTQFQRMSGLVTQEDVFEGSLTVAETLGFSAALKIQKDLRHGRVDYLIKLLQLEKCRDTYSE